MKKNLQRYKNKLKNKENGLSFAYKDDWTLDDA